MTKTNRTARTAAVYYRVRAFITVDRPEMRNASYPVVKAGTSCPFSKDFATSREAVAHYEEIVGGTFDGESEFVRVVGVESMGYDGAILRTLRRRVERERTAPGRCAERAPHRY